MSAHIPAPPNHRAIRSPFFTRAAFCFLLSAFCFSVPAAPSVTVWGFLHDVDDTGLSTYINFTPPRQALISSLGLSVGIAHTFSITNGVFTNRLDAGDYWVTLPLNQWKDPFMISVPSFGGPYNITNLLSDPTTYGSFIMPADVTNIVLAIGVASGPTNGIQQLNGSGTNTALSNPAISSGTIASSTAISSNNFVGQFVGNATGLTNVLRSYVTPFDLFPLVALGQGSDDGAYLQATIDYATNGYTVRIPPAAAGYWTSSVSLKLNQSANYLVEGSDAWGNYQVPGAKTEIRFGPNIDGIVVGGPGIDADGMTIRNLCLKGSSMNPTNRGFALTAAPSATDNYQIEACTAQNWGYGFVINAASVGTIRQCSAASNAWAFAVGAGARAGEPGPGVNANIFENCAASRSYSNSVWIGGGNFTVFKACDLGEDPGYPSPGELIAGGGSVVFEDCNIEHWTAGTEVVIYGGATVYFNRTGFGNNASDTTHYAIAVTNNGVAPSQYWNNVIILDQNGSLNGFAGLGCPIFDYNNDARSQVVSWFPVVERWYNGSVLITNVLCGYDRHAQAIQSIGYDDGLTATTTGSGYHYWASVASGGNIDDSLIYEARFGSVYGTNYPTRIDLFDFAKSKSGTIAANNITLAGTITGNGAGLTNIPGGGSQSPWTSDINAAGFSLTNLGSLQLTGTLTVATLEITNGFYTGSTNLSYTATDANGKVIAGTTLTPPANGSYDVGAAGTAFRDGYFARVLAGTFGLFTNWVQVGAGVTNNTGTIWSPQFAGGTFIGTTFTGVQGTNVLGRGFHTTNQLTATATGFALDASRPMSLLVTNATMAISGLQNLVTGIRWAGSCAVSNSAASTIWVTNPPSCGLIGSASTNALAIGSGKMGYWSFDCVTGVYTNACNATQQ